MHYPGRSHGCRLLQNPAQATPSMSPSPNSLLLAKPRTFLSCTMQPQPGFFFYFVLFIWKAEFHRDKDLFHVPALRRVQASFESPTWTEVLVLGPCSAVFPGALAARWIRSRAAGTRTRAHKGYHSHCCTTMQTPIRLSASSPVAQEAVWPTWLRG